MTFEVALVDVEIIVFRCNSTSLEYEMEFNNIILACDFIYYPELLSIFNIFIPQFGDSMTNIVIVQFADNVQTGRDKRFNLTCLFHQPGEAVVTSSFIGAG